MTAAIALAVLWLLFIAGLLRVFVGRRVGERLAEAEFAEHCRTAGVGESGVFTPGELQAMRLIAAMDAAETHR